MFQFRAGRYGAGRIAVHPVRSRRLDMTTATVPTLGAEPPGRRVLGPYSSGNASGTPRARTDLVQEPPSKSTYIYKITAGGFVDKKQVIS